MGTQYFSDVAKTVATRMEKTTKAERVVTEILERVLEDQNVPVPHFEVDTDDNVYLVYDLESAPKTEEMVVLTAIFPDLTNKGGSKLKIYYYDTF
jgi:hypothetical protein